MQDAPAPGSDAETRQLLHSLVEQLLATLWILCEHLDAAVDAVTHDDAVLQAILDTLGSGVNDAPFATRLVAGPRRGPWDPLRFRKGAQRTS